ncbi:class I SAM-dependent methyltransferase [Knoellia sp. S7-12]|uniref:class I SAM-dependent methyltransferase n=1 Tax=Knoellia sp. S7-12 TaxID=3126698 RepID=UPI003365F703
MNEHHERGHGDHYGHLNHGDVGDAGHCRAGHAPADWDALYAESDRIWSGNPNGALVSEATGLTPGTALDVGCGEGADAIWLAQQGWQVTAIDVSSVALDRARAHGEGAGVAVDWQVTSFMGMPSRDSRFDLVIAFYAALVKDGGATLSTLLDAVAPGGTLLFVHHADVDREQALEHGFNPDHFLDVAEVASALDRGWTIDVHEIRDRDIDGGAGQHHTRDVVLRALRSPVL